MGRRHHLVRTWQGFAYKASVTVVLLSGTYHRIRALDKRGAASVEIWHARHDTPTPVETTEDDVPWVEQESSPGETSSSPAKRPRSASSDAAASGVSSPSSSPATSTSRWRAPKRSCCLCSDAYPRRVTRRAAQTPRRCRRYMTGCRRSPVWRLRSVDVC